MRDEAGHEDCKYGGTKVNKIVVSIKQGLGELTSDRLQIRKEKIFTYPLKKHKRATRAGMLVILECDELGSNWIDILMVPYQMLNYCAVVDEPDEEECDVNAEIH